MDGYRVDTTITDGITQFPTPSNRTDLRAFFGLANQLAASTDSVATLLGPYATVAQHQERVPVDTHPP